MRLVVITRDKRIRYRPGEKRLWVEHRVRGFVLTGHRSQSTSDSLAVLDRHWARIETLIDRETDGPWMQAVTLAGISPIDLSRLPEDDDPELAWSVPDGPELAYDGEIPEDVLRLAEQRRQNPT